MGEDPKFTTASPRASGFESRPDRLEAAVRGAKWEGSLVLRLLDAPPKELFWSAPLTRDYEVFALLPECDVRLIWKTAGPVRS